MTYITHHRQADALNFSPSPSPSPSPWVPPLLLLFVEVDFEGEIPLLFHAIDSTTVTTEGFHKGADGTLLGLLHKMVGFRLYLGQFSGDLFLYVVLHIK